MTEAELAIVRRAYAKQVMVPYNAAHPRVEAAFAVVRREAFLGPGPYQNPLNRRQGVLFGGGSPRVARLWPNAMRRLREITPTGSG